MNEENPYSAPATVDPIPPQASNSIELASLGDRFLGALVDGLVNIAIAIPIWAALFMIGTVKSLQEMGEIGLVMTVVISLVSFGLFILVQGRFLKATGQTIGKKVVKTRIVTMEGKKPEFMDLVIKRYAFMNLIALVPFVGGILSLIDALMVFKSDRRCLHDNVAGTQVVKVQPGEVIS